MVCKSVGEANPDIAGIGILVAFSVQSLIAVFVSFYTFILSSIIQQRWKDAEPDSRPSSPPPPPPQPNDGIPTWLNFLQRRFRALQTFCSKLLDPTLALNAMAAWISPRSRSREQRADESKYAKIPDWIIGEQPKHRRQRTRESKIEDEPTPTAKRLRFANRILLAGNDAQTFTGIALLISALVQSKTLCLYHMHVLYDTISLVVISNCAASMCVFSEGRFKGYTRLCLMAIWSILYISYFAIFATRLQHWDENTPLRCYRTKNIARPGDPHPRSDHAYIGVTFVYTVVTIFYAVYVQFIESLFTKLSDPLRPSNSHEFSVALQDAVRPSLYSAQFLYSMQPDQIATFAQNFIVGVAMAQCPVHIYSIFALRAANERYLDAGGTERDWGFGQIVAMVLLGSNILSIADGFTGSIEESEATRVLGEEAQPDVEMDRLAVDIGVLQDDAETSGHPP